MSNLPVWFTEATHGPYVSSFSSQDIHPAGFSIPVAPVTSVVPIAPIAPIDPVVPLAPVVSLAPAVSSPPPRPPRSQPSRSRGSFRPSRGAIDSASHCRHWWQKTKWGLPEEDRTCQDCGRIQTVGLFECIRTCGIKICMSCRKRHHWT